MTTKVVVLISGGLDSSTVLGKAVSMGLEIFPLSFDYGQRHRRELTSASSVIAWFQNQAGEHKIHQPRCVTLLGLELVSSALTDNSLAVPVNRDEATMSADIPVTYVPARNSIFLAIATAVAEAHDCDQVWTGFNAVDYSGYPDCRPEYVEAMERALALGTKRGLEGRGIQIHAPLIRMSKVDIVRAAKEYSVPIEKTWSCYKGEAKPCGECDSCVIRDKAIREVEAAA